MPATKTKTKARPTRAAKAVRDIPITFSVADIPQLRPARADKAARDILLKVLCRGQSDPVVSRPAFWQGASANARIAAELVRECETIGEARKVLALAAVAANEIADETA